MLHKKIKMYALYTVKFSLALCLSNKKKYIYIMLHSRMVLNDLYVLRVTYIIYLDDKYSGEQ